MEHHVHGLGGLPPFGVEGVDEGSPLDASTALRRAEGRENFPAKKKKPKKGGYDLRKMWAMSRQLLGMTDREFLLRTPFEVALLYDAKLDVVEMEDARAALICSTLANIYREPKSKPIPVSAYMLKRRKPKAGEKGEANSQSPIQMLNHFKAITKLAGGWIAPQHGNITVEEAQRIIGVGGL